MGGRRRTVKRGGAYGPLPASEQTIVGTMLVDKVNTSGPVAGGPMSVTDQAGGRRRTRRVIKKKSVAAIKRLLKAKGLKVSGSRRAVTARARKARIPLKGGGSTTGTPYHSYTGAGDAGKISPFIAANPVSNNVLDMPGYGSDSGAFRSTGSGGLAEA
jgi:hypothetical protein